MTKCTCNLYSAGHGCLLGMVQMQHRNSYFGQVCRHHEEIKSLLHVSPSLMHPAHGVPCRWQIWCFFDDSFQQGNRFLMPVIEHLLHWEIRVSTECTGEAKHGRTRSFSFTDVLALTLILHYELYLLLA